MVSKTCGIQLISRPVVSRYPIEGSLLSINDGDGYENAPQLKSKFALVQSSSLLFHLVKLVKCSQIFLELISKRLCHSLGKEKGQR